MSVTSLAKDLSLLKGAVRKAGEIAMARYGREKLEVWTKPGNEPVTEVDFAVNEALKKMLMGARPDYGWLSEESTDDKERLKKDRVWVVDPIDGTRAYIRGKPDFSINVGLLEKTQPVLGVTYAPALDKFYEGLVGEGAFLNGRKLRGSKKSNFSDFSLQSSPEYIQSKKRWKTPWPEMKVSKCQSFALRLAAFAEGKTDAVLAATPKSEWDVVPGAVFINEIGGILCDQHGQPLIFNKSHPVLHQIVAVPPNLKKEFLKFVQGRIAKNSP